MNRTITRTVVATAVITGVFVAGSAAGAATGWRPFATGSDAGQYGAYASASGDVVKPKGLAIRVRSSGDSTPDIDYYFSCSGKIRARSGVTYTIDVSKSAKCNVNGSAITDNGSVTVTLLKR